MFIFFNGAATTEIYTLSLHDALPISARPAAVRADARRARPRAAAQPGRARPPPAPRRAHSGPARAAHRPRQLGRSEEHTSELQSRQYLVCRLLLEKKKCIS